MSKTDKKLYRARLETRNFEFEAFDTTPDKARTALILGLHAHGHQYQLAKDWHESLLAEGVEISELGLGNAYRDRQALLLRN